MAPEYTRAAKGLHPLIPVYAVDCDDEGNKRLCAEQVGLCLSIPVFLLFIIISLCKGVQGFPTIKVCL